MKAFIFLPLLLALTACGGDYKDPVSAAAGQELSFGSQKVRVVDGSLAVTNGSIQGTGSLIFDSRYEEFKSAGSYSLDFSLEEGGSVKLVSHANENLMNGFELEFRRQGSGAGSLKVALLAQGSAWNAVTNFAAINAAEAIRLQADVHNDESPAHVLVWSRLLGEDFAKEKSVLNSADEVDGSPGIGTGVRWGLVLNKATVTRAEKSEPKFGH